MPDYLKLFNEAKTLYFSIGKVICHCLNNEPVIFGDAGWRHMIYKPKHMRPISDRIRRFKLLKCATSVLENKNVSVTARTIYKNNRTLYFWNLETEMDDLKLRLVIRQIGSGPKEFFSIMSK